MNNVSLFHPLLVLLCGLAILHAQTMPPASTTTTSKPVTPVTQALENAQSLFKKQNWGEARDAYDKARDLVNNWNSPQARLATEGAVACSLKLSQWDDALSRARNFISQNKGLFEEVVGERFLGGLYLCIPHYGTKQGGEYHRGEYGQGVQVESFKKDRKESIHHYERARDLLIALQNNTDAGTSLEQGKLYNSEQIGTDFDLATALTNQNRFGYGFYGWCGLWWWSGWGEAEEESDALEEADYEQPRWGRWRYNAEQEKPTGIPLTDNGQPRFIAASTTYAATLGDGQKIRFLLDEIQKIDRTGTQDNAAQALFRKAMICRSLYGPDIIQLWNNSLTRNDRWGRPILQPKTDDEPKKKIWELADDEAIVIAGGRLQVAMLPADESPLSLLNEIVRLYPKSKFLPEALYTRGLYFQTRQQFPEAITAYEKLRKAYPAHKRSHDASDQIQRIQKPGIMLNATGVYLPDSKPSLSFSYRNAGEVTFTAKHFNMDGLIKTYLEKFAQDENNSWRWNLQNIPTQLFQEDPNIDIHWKDYVDKNEFAHWTEKVTLNESNRAETATTAAPITEPGAYVIEAQVAGSEQTSRTLILVSDIAIIHKNIEGKGLIYIADARTGQPLPDLPVKMVETWNEYIEAKQKRLSHVDSFDLKTNADGVIEYKYKHSSNINALISLPKNRMAFSFFQNWQESNYRQEQFENGQRIYVITDRPVYRPGETVHYRIWFRTRSNGKFEQPSKGNALNIEVRDPKNTEVKASHRVETDESGCVSEDLLIPEGAALGTYQINVNGYGNYYNGYRNTAGNIFRVEEYKRPEFEVKVTPSKTQARLGEKVSARIEARYYFGAPVAKGEISYKVYRENYQHVYWGPGEYDWLYGKGYGRYHYAYPWFPWWGRWGCFILNDWSWPYHGWSNRTFSGGDYEEMERRTMESGTRKALRELVAQGKGELKSDGTYDVQFDTAPAKRDLGNHDHRYTIEAEVRDESRRTITGQGDVKVTRQAFYAFAEANNGWYQPQSDAFIEIRTLAPDNVPVATEGKVTISNIQYDSSQSAAKEVEVKSWNASTDKEGRLSFKYSIPSEGQYRVTYKTQDSWKEEVQANTVFWVYGPKFDGSVYRFNNLEIVADKRTYQPGETAHLLINTAENNSRILFSDDVSEGMLRTYRFIDLPQRSTVIDIPITNAHLPNFFVEATLVRNGQVHQEMREIYVPPAKNILSFSIETDKAVYKPGEQGKVRVKLQDASGKPVAGDVTLTAFDESLTYIQDEFGPAPKIFYYGQRRTHEPYVDSSLEREFSADGSFERPEYNNYYNSAPEGWNGSWSISSGGLTLSGGNMRAEESKDLEESYKERDFLIDYGHGIAGKSLVSGVGLAAGQAVDALDSAAAPAAPVAKEAANLDSLHAELQDTKSQLRKDSDTGSWIDSLFITKLIDPSIRTNFAATALWLPHLKTDANGQAETTITFPDSLTTWRVHGYGITDDTQVGDAIAHANTSKNLIVRLQAPRFFIERDEAVLSANVHNYLGKSKKVTAELIFTAAQLQPLDSANANLKPDKDGNIHLTATASVKAGAETRFDWPVKVVHEGLARVTVKALTDEESDAMQLAFPVLVHGINKMVAQGGSYRVDDNGERSLKLDLPTEIDPEQTKLEITLSPSLGGVMVDALPYLVGYPYGCVEQTMSRFYPSVLVKDTLKKMGTDLEAIAKQRRQMNPADAKNRFGRDRNPVYDTDELNNMIRAGLQRISNFQHEDGGWGWWKEDESSPYQTAYVVQGLLNAQQAGVNFNNGMLSNGFNFLQNSIRKELIKPKDKQNLGDFETQAYIAYTLALGDRIQNDDQKKWLDNLFETRGEQNNYGRALLALTFKLRKQDDRASLLLENILQFVDRDDSNETAWIRTPSQGWWFWWNNDIETNAWALRALVAIDPKNDISPRIVKWLLNNRKNGYYWRSTRDTAVVIASMADYMRASGEANPDYNLIVKLDGEAVKEVKVTKENFFTFDNRVALYGLHVKPGPHTVTLEKQGSGALYYSAYLSYFTKEEDIKGAGNEIEITREYYLLKPKTESVLVSSPANSSRGWFGYFWKSSPPAAQEKSDEDTSRKELRSGFDRVLLKTGDSVASGDQIEVVLKIKSKNTYDYLAFEDMKPAGCEPVDLRSGGKFAGGLCPNVELRDTKVVFFIGLLEQGNHILRYKLRAETPGTFHALPTSGFAMYAPEVRAISDEMRLKITDH